MMICWVVEWMIGCVVRLLMRCVDRRYLGRCRGGSPVAAGAVDHGSF